MPKESRAAGKSDIILVGLLADFFSALGYKTTASDRRLTVDDSALLTSSRQEIVAGNAQYIDDDEILTGPPRFVVVEDGAPSQHVARLKTVCDACKAPPKLVSFSRFIDPLWQADSAARVAQEDARSASDLDVMTGLSAADRSNPLAQYADQVIKSHDGGDRRQNALRFCEEWMESGTGGLVVLAPAGLGKSELAALLEWRAALNFFNATSKETYDPPPPLALRVQLRDLPSAGLSLETIAEYLRTIRGLERIRNDQVLSQLLLHGRIVLVLDGLDELAIQRSRLEDGLEELNFIAESGAKILITTRTGYYGSEGAIRAKLKRESIVQLEPLDEEAGLDLLTKRGASIEEAKRAIGVLMPELRGVPLFLIWAWKSDYHEKRDAASIAGRARTLFDFVRLFCVRDEPRVRLPADAQVDILVDLAFENAFVGKVTQGDFSFLVGAEDSPMVEGPHALLRLGDDGAMVFREATFESLFLAQGILRAWDARSVGGEGDLRLWLGDRLGAVKLESLTVDFLGELLSDDELRQGWTLASQAPARYQPFTRRNLLAIALAKLRDRATGESAERRAQILESLLGSTDISETVLLDLVIEQVDFKGWNLMGCVGRGAYLAFCQFAGADFDSSLDGADADGCSGLSIQVPDDEVIRSGMRRLQRVLGPWRHHALGESALKTEVSEKTRGLDHDGMRTLRARGLADLKAGKRGVKYWHLTEGARRLFRDWLMSPSVSPPELKQLARDLAQST